MATSAPATTSLTWVPLNFKTTVRLLAMNGFMKQMPR